MPLKHVILRNSRLKGWEYGMLRALETEIAKQTGATIIEVPDYGNHALTKRMGHSMRFDPARKWLPKKSFKIEADVLWYILMGPENYELDLFKDWDIKATYRIAYIFDTLEPQFNLVQKLFSNDLFNIRVTSFNDAVPYLEQLTNKKWHNVEQAVPLEVFRPVPAEEKIIHFSSYGRRLPLFHETLLEFCVANNLYYDFTTHDARHPTAVEEELYKQYAWHISHSLFTVSWPVELTNPQRAGRLNPITCRWFEAASVGTVIIGKKPDNDLFESQLANDVVVELDPFAEKSKLLACLDNLYKDRESLIARAAVLQQQHAHRWSWSERVSRMQQLISG